MKRIAILASVCVLSLAACKKKDGDKPAAADKVAEPATPAAPPPPFTGKLTAERVLGAKGLVDPLVPWADGLAKLKDQLGEPTRVKDGKYEWAVVEGDDCAYVYVTKVDGAKFKQTGEVVGEVMSPMKVGKDGPSGNRDQCLEITGVTPGPPEAADAAPPPTDGAPVTVAVYRDAAIAGRSKWKDQPITVTGVFAGTTTSTSGADSWTTVSLKNAADDDGKPVACSLAKNAPAPTFTTGDKVAATGKVKIQEWHSMGKGDTTLEAAVDECTVVKAK